MANTPNIRFKGFSEEWEERKLGEVFSERTERANGNEELLSVTIANGVIRQADSDKRNFASEDKSNYKVVKKGDVPYNSMRMWQGSVGMSEYDGIVSPAYTVLTPNQHANGKFFMELFKKDSTLEIFKRWSQGITSDTWNLKYPALSSIAFYIPTVVEQSKMAGYFLKLDNLITLHQRKCDETKELKKYMLQKMFPKKGEKIPEIRFAGFSGEWKQHKVGEIAGKVYGGGTPKTAMAEYWDGNIPWIQSSNLKEHELFDVDIQKHITDEGLKKSAAQLVPQNSIAVVSHVGVGKLVFMPYSYTTSQDFISLSELNAEPIFTCYSIYKRLQSDIHIVQGSAIKGITKEDLLNKELLLPGEQEQVEIGNYFYTLDTQITHHQQKCDQLKELKKFMLQNMFPQKG